MCRSIHGVSYGWDTLCLITSIERKLRIPTQGDGNNHAWYIINYSLRLMSSELSLGFFCCFPGGLIGIDGWFTDAEMYQHYRSASTYYESHGNPRVIHIYNSLHTDSDNYSCMHDPFYSKGGLFINFNDNIHGNNKYLISFLTLILSYPLVNVILQWKAPDDIWKDV